MIWKHFSLHSVGAVFTSPKSTVRFSPVGARVKMHLFAVTSQVFFSILRCWNTWCNMWCCLWTQKWYRLIVPSWSRPLKTCHLSWVVQQKTWILVESRAMSLCIIFLCVDTKCLSPRVRFQTLAKYSLHQMYLTPWRYPLDSYSKTSSATMSVVLRWPTICFKSFKIWWFLKV